MDKTQFYLRMRRIYMGWFEEAAKSSKDGTLKLSPIEIIRDWLIVLHPKTEPERKDKMDKAQFYLRMRRIYREWSEEAAKSSKDGTLKLSPKEIIRDWLRAAGIESDEALEAITGDPEKLIEHLVR